MATRRGGSIVATVLALSLGCAAEDTWDPTLHASIAQAKDAALRGDFDEADALLDTVLSAPGVTGDPSAHAEALAWKGNVARQRGDYEASEALGSAALDAVEREGLDSLLARVHNGLGLVAYEVGHLIDADAHLAAGLEAAQRLGQEDLAVVIEGNQALIHLNMGRFQEAREGFLEYAEKSLATDSVRNYAIALTNLAMLSVALGRPGDAVAPAGSAVSTFRELGTGAYEQAALAHLSDAYRGLGLASQAEETLEEASALAEQLGQRAEVARNIEARARLYWDAGETTRSLEWFGRARSHYEEMGSLIELGKTLRDMGQIHLHVGNVELAERLGTEALALHRETADRYEELFDLLFLAEVARERSRTDLARRYLDQGDSAWAADGSQATRHALLLSRGALAVEEGEGAAGRGAIVPVLEESLEAEPSVRTEAYRQYAALWALDQEWDSAAAWGERAIDEMDQMRGNLGTAMAMTTFVARRTQTYVDLVRYLTATGRADEAFLVSDRIRARTILHQVGLVDESRLVPEDPLAAAAQANLLARQGESLDYDLEDPWVDEATVESMRSLRTATATRSGELVGGAIESRPGRAALLGLTDVGIEDIQAALEPGDVLVQYLVGDSVLTVFGMSSSALASARVPVTSADLTDRLRVARELLGRPDVSQEDAGPVLGALHQILWRDVVDRLSEGGLPEIDQAERVYFVPHGPLTYLPFAALWEGQSGRYLVEDYEVVVVPAASVLAAVARRDSGGESDAGQTAGPERGTEPVLFAPMDQELPHTRLEAEAIAEAFPGARVRIGPEATEDAFREAFLSASVVHVATHGALNPQSPLLSRIELAPSGNATTAAERGQLRTGGSRGPGLGSEEDGVLEVHEVLTLNGRSRLVFLSGCETGLGVAGSNRFAPGDDLATLAQAFLYAGARNVVATLWAIEDESAARFTTWFYEAGGASDPGAALRSAQLRALDDPVLSAPYHWASYQVMGLGR